MMCPSETIVAPFSTIFCLKKIIYHLPKDKAFYGTAKRSIKTRRMKIFAEFQKKCRR
jgi:hypothetical protein